MKFDWHHAASLRVNLNNLEIDVHEAQRDVEDFIRDAYEHGTDADFKQLHELEKILDRAEKMIGKLRKVEAFYDENTK